MSKKFIPVLIVLILVGLFIGFGVMGRSDKRNDDPKTKYEKILKYVGIVLEQGHYDPKKIDDKFSQEVLKKFENELDPDKYIFLQSDIDSFEDKYGNRIDDEIHGNVPLESFYGVSNTYLKRLNEVSASYKEMLKQPFDFNKNEWLQTDGDKRNYPATIAERKDYGRKRLKYLVLGRYVDLQEERAANMKKDSTYKPDSTLEREAIESVSRQMNRFFETLKNHNSSEELFSTFVNCITGAMDPHTTYFAPVDKRSFDEMLSGTFYGIGAQLQQKDGKILIASLITGMPAWKTGKITPGDEIIKVGQGDATPVDIRGYALEDAVKLIRGAKEGSVVKLTLKKADGTIKVIPVIRGKISLDATFARSAVINNNGHKIGYIYLPEFYANFDDPSARRSSTDVAKEVKKLKAAHVESIIIDLRGNGGGSLSDVVDMVGLFVKNGPVVQVKGRDGAPSVLDDKNSTVLYSGPLAVMVDELSASASEIFAAAIQDYHRGIIIGSPTYGKGTVQRSVSLDPQSENPFFSQPAEGLGDVKLTFRKFYRINGGSTQLRGVVPDIILPDRLENAKLRERDNPDALHWDEIPKADYTIWNPGYSYASVVAQIDSQISKNVDFEGIKKEVDVLEKYQNEESPLNIVQYKKMQKEINDASKRLDAYSKLKVDLQAHTLEVDSLAMVGDTAKIDREKQFISSIDNDIYINEAVKVLEKVIGEKQLAESK
ncbi:MAG TPA: carboxy terminal-processing peptidase [Hanamia sp.]|nr:carboxy terminal-processing peptidase [Hanamia sp.]